MQDFKEWFDTTGYEYYDEIMEYLENCPDSIDITTDLGVFDMDEFAFMKCEDIFEGLIGDYNDRCYDEYKDNRDD